MPFNEKENDVYEQFVLLQYLGILMHNKLKVKIKTFFISQ